MRGKMADQSQTPHAQSVPVLNSKDVPLVKPERESVRREIDRIARQLEGLSKSLKRLKQTA